MNIDETKNKPLYLDDQKYLWVLKVRVFVLYGADVDLWYPMQYAWLYLHHIFYRYENLLSSIPSDILNIISNGKNWPMGQVNFIAFPDHVFFFQ